MGLFDGGAKKNAIENAILQALSQQQILDDAIETILQNDAKWLTNCQSYYDSRQRQVIIAADLFQIKWSDYHYEGERRVEDIIDEVRYSYTASGYTPLHGHVNEKGKEDVSVGRVIYLWASLIRERMQAKMPGCSFGPVNELNNFSAFTYTVPPLTWKRWF